MIAAILLCETLLSTICAAFCDMKKLSLCLVVLLYVISLISCSDNQLEGENDIAISFSQEGGVYSIPVSDQAHIEFIQDESTHFYKECKGQDSISIENVAYKHFSAYIKGQKLFLQVGKNRNMKIQKIMIALYDNEPKKIKCTIEKADSCVIENIIYGNPVKRSYTNKKEFLKVDSLKKNVFSCTLYPLSCSYGMLMFNRADDVKEVLPLEDESLVSVPKRDCLKNEKIIFDTGAKIEITDAFWKSFPYVIKKDSNLDKDVLGFSVEYVEEEIPTEIKIKNVSRGTSHIIQCMATLSYPTGNITQE